ncbi:MAG: methyltransferase domain-containing protein [Bacillota bacterium]
MDLKELQKNWNEFGKKDPLWAILTHNDKKGGKWDINEFFQTGREEIEDVLNWVNSLGISLRKNRALDFGCGVGRLTQALCLYFDNCHGIDIAPSMIELAKKFNSYAGRCRYHVNEADNLELFESNYFDFIYSNIVLQHIEPRFGKNYIKEFIRVLSPGGTVVFQAPDRPEVQTDPLPDSAFRAEITVLEDNKTLKSGSEALLSVKIKNISDAIWPHLNGERAIRLGNHWLNEAGDVVINDDGRVPLPLSLRPGKEVNVLLPVMAPDVPGNYILELDMVQEAVAWFKNRGSKTARLSIRVESDNSEKTTTEKSPGAISMTPRMEMHVLPRESVLELIDQCGGNVISVVENNNAPGWISYTYCVTK